ncbi:DUF4190 domain-containing protein [Leifsonia shinshuensis]|uniref:DUF4190 domain-containing protein n=1 Tax=Leifsonia shinshuensis TaxID=150026 RepID=UPI00286639AC|nr:DUF4190 domain-containing protein [Leifsonia shinshuensis]MDR6970784.1 hypothetical protein [Leifsonia shinshuensis]
MPPAPYGAAPQPPKKSGNGFAVAALVLGIVGVVFAFTPAAGFGIVLGVLALVFGILSLVRKPAKSGIPISGTALGAAALVIGMIFAVVYGGGKAASPVADAPAAATSSSASTPAAAAPSPEPSKTETPPDPNAAYDKAYGTFAPVNQAGSGDTVIAIPARAKAGIVIASHNGSSNFSINVLDANNQSTGDLLVNTIGAYSGTTAFGMHSIGGTGTNLQVTADGQWNITISPVSSAPDFPLPGSATGDQVYKYGGKAANMAFTNQGQGNFAVIQYGAAFPNLAVNEIGPYNGKVPMLAGPSVITVTSDGAWTVAAG